MGVTLKSVAFLSSDGDGPYLPLRLSKQRQCHAKFWSLAIKANIDQPLHPVLQI